MHHIYLFFKKTAYNTGIIMFNKSFFPREQIITKNNIKIQIFACISKVGAESLK